MGHSWGGGEEGIGWSDSCEVTMINIGLHKVQTHGHDPQHKGRGEKKNGELPHCTSFIQLMNE